MNPTILQLGCSHLPKVAKKIGSIHGDYCEILVCKDCKNDSDLMHFKEIKIE